MTTYILLVLAMLQAFATYRAWRKPPPYLLHGVNAAPWVWRLVLHMPLLLLLACGSAYAQTAPQLVRDDLQTYLDGGDSALGWRQIVTTAGQLQRAYSENEIAAGERYAFGPDIVVSGTVRQVSERAVILEGADRFVNPRLMDMPPAWAVTLAPGQRIRVACKTVRKVGAWPVLQQCEPLGDYIERMVAAYTRALPRLVAQGDAGAMLVQRRAKP